MRGAAQPRRTPSAHSASAGPRGYSLGEERPAQDVETVEQAAQFTRTQLRQRQRQIGMRTVAYTAQSRATGRRDLKLRSPSIVPRRARSQRACAHQPIDHRRSRRQRDAKERRNVADRATRLARHKMKTSKLRHGHLLANILASCRAQSVHNRRHRVEDGRSAFLGARPTAGLCRSGGRSIQTRAVFHAVC